MSRTDSAFTDLLARARHSAVHLKMRDSYGIGEEAAEFERWRSGWRPEPNPETWWNDFHTWVRDAKARGVALRREGARPVWFYSLADMSWACVLFQDGDRARVWQWGPRRLWDEAVGAYEWWRDRGSLGLHRFGLTVSSSGQRVWLDNPSAESWPLDVSPA
ncbi:DUF6879 family protein [Streptomyces griseofuscus]|uniref:DUF6879 family protein n=1 Tax=Streptomyces griseofuscus TaxID=146922 RepID=UPI0033D60839